MSEQFWGVLGLALISVPAILILRLLIRSRIRARKDGPVPVEGKTLPEFEVGTGSPGIDLADCADAAAQQAALERLCRLPQFHRLPDNTVIDWGSGAELTPCDCSKSPVPHLMVSWGKRRAIGLMTKKGLAHYVAYQERVADVLLTGQVARPDLASGAMGADRADLSTSSEPKEAH